MRAGGKVTFEIACDKEWTSYGHHYYTGRPGLANQVLIVIHHLRPLTFCQDACPTDVGAYHADPAAKIVNTTLIKGCALGIADTDDIRKVGMNDITVFSVQKNCVYNKTTDFYIPPKSVLFSSVCVLADGCAIGCQSAQRASASALGIGSQRPGRPTTT